MTLKAEELKELQEAQKELVKVCKQSVQELGVENAIAQSMANQYGLEQVQSDFHCLLLTLVNIIIDKNIITKEEFDKLYTERSKQQQEEIKEALNQNRQ